MAMPIILKGDTSAEISFTLSSDFDYAGYSLRVDFHHVSNVIYDLQPGETVSVQYSAKDTSRFPLGTGLVMLILENEEGVRRTLPMERVKVTDAPAEVYDCAISIDPGAATVEELPERFTDNDVRTKINQIISCIKRSIAFFAFLAMSSEVLAASVLTAPKGEIYNDSPVVTNVSLEGLAKKDDIDKATNNIPQIVTNVVSDVSESLFNDYISATNDNFVAAVNASQVSVDDSVVAEIAEYAGVDVPTAGAASIGALLIVILGGLAALKLKKQDALSQEQVAAVNSGITADKVSKLEGIEAGAQKNPDLTEYAKKSGVVKLYMDEDDPYVGNDLGDLGTSSPRELLAFTATVDVEDLKGNLIRSGDNVYGTVGADGFKVHREWAKPDDEYAKYGVYSKLDAGRLDIFRTFYEDEYYWVEARESFSVGTEETPDGGLGIVLRFQAAEEGRSENFASAMTPGYIYADYICGGLNTYKERGYGGVQHIEFDQNADIGYSYYDDTFGCESSLTVDIQYIVQVADDYSTGSLENLSSIEFQPYGSNEIRFYEYDYKYDHFNDRVIYLSEIFNMVKRGICFGDNYHSYDDTGTSAAFGLIDSNNESICAYFGTYGMEANDNESRRYTMITSDQICTTSYTESGEWWASASIDPFGRVYASVNIQTDGWVDAAQGITIGDAVLDQESLQKLLALIAE